MKILAKIKETKVIKALVKWQNTMWYPVVFAALGVVSALFGVYAYVPIFYVYAVSVVFAALFNDDLKVYLTPLILIFFTVGKDGIIGDTDGIAFDNVINDTMNMFSVAGFVQMVICTAVMICAFGWKLWQAGVIRDMFKRRGRFLFGIILLDIAFIFNGVFSSHWNGIDLAYGVLEAFGFTIFYLVVGAWISKCNDAVAYACKVMMLLGFMIAAEVGILSLMLWQQGKLFINGVFQRDFISFGWGVSTLAGGVVALSVAACMYIAHSRKKGTFAYLAAVLLYMVVLYLQARTSILFAGVVLLAGIIICCVSGKNKVANRYFTAIVVGLGIVAFTFVLKHYGGISGFIQKLNDMDIFHMSSGMNERDWRWKNGWGDFCGAPIFGVGFDKGAVSVSEKYSNLFLRMYHNIFVELLGAMGIFGFIAFLVHFKRFIEEGVRDFTCEKLMLWMVPALVLLMSFFDNFFFMVNMQLYYGTFLAILEEKTNLDRAEKTEHIKKVPYGAKPRVALLSAKEVKSETLEAFKAVCGKDVEVLEVIISDEKLRARAEKSASATGFKKFMHRVARFVLGDTLAAKWMTCGCAKKERAALAGLNVDAVMATDWAAAQIASGIRGKKQPYVATVNESFDGRMNANVNDAIFLSEKEYKRADAVRGYACGHIEKAASAQEAAEFLYNKVMGIPHAEKSETLE